MTKEAIRKEYKLKRRKLIAGQIMIAEDLMLINFQKLKLPKFNCLMSYLPIEAQNEFNPINAEDYYKFMNERMSLAFPIVNFENETMRAVIVFDENEYEENRYGVIEPIGGIKLHPKDIDVMIVPLIAFDKNGYRVGYGKGYYDKFIAECKPEMIKIGFSFFDPVEIDDVNEFDKKLDYCITPEKIYTFKK